MRNLGRLPKQHTYEGISLHRTQNPLMLKGEIHKMQQVEMLQALPMVGVEYPAVIEGILVYAFQKLNPMICLPRGEVLVSHLLKVVMITLVVTLPPAPMVLEKLQMQIILLRKEKMKKPIFLFQARWMR